MPGRACPSLSKAPLRISRIHSLPPPGDSILRLTVSGWREYEIPSANCLTTRPALSVQQTPPGSRVALVPLSRRGESLPRRDLRLAETSAQNLSSAAD